MNTRRGMTIALLLVSFIAGIAANNIYHKRRSAGYSASGAALSGKQQEIDQLMDAKEQELRAALQLLAKRHGNTASVLNRREHILSRMIKDLSGINGSSIYNFGIYHTYSGVIKSYLGDNPNPRVLEIGPGINLGTGLIFTMTGARKYYGLDLYRDPDLLGAPQYESIVTLLSRIAPADVKTPADAIMNISGEQVTFQKEKVEYLYPREAHDIPLDDGSLDFVFSHSTLEHVVDPSMTLNTIFRVLRKGGVTAHHIDLRDHRDFSRPLEFLKDEASAWEKKRAAAQAHLYNMNRWRTSDYRIALERRGFQVLKIQPTETHAVSEELRRSLHPDFQKYGMEDLSVTGVLIIAKKP